MRSLIALDIHSGLDTRGGSRLVDAILRIWDQGNAVLPLDTRAPVPHVDSVLAQMRPAAIEVVGSGRTELPDPIPVEDGDALVITTSGTTGRPKGVIHTHASMTAAAKLTGAATGTTADSHWLACIPLVHIGGFSVITRALGCGSKLTIHDGFDAGQVNMTMRAGGTHVSLVPAVLDRIDVAGWELILLGGSAVPPDRPSNTIATYGMTETFGGVVYDGTPLLGVDVRVGHGSALEIRSPTLFRAYRGNDLTETEPVLTPDGFLRTGDLGSVDPNTGVVTVEGRADDLIISGGVKIWPAPVEALIATHPLVSECIVIGREDYEWGQRVVAVVVPGYPGNPPELAELRDLVKSRFPAASAPRELVITPSLPRTTSGKVRRVDPSSIAEGTYHQ